jgi:2-oxoglutarate dehydrogenase E1 component
MRERGREGDEKKKRVETKKTQPRPTPSKHQVAFTTDPRKSRSSPYCTDVAKALNAPILHVNGDDVEAVVRAMEMAAEWRAAWKTDVVVDIVCYRRHGHNEIDEPMFTQPLMYRAIKKHTDPFRLYQRKLLAEGVVTQPDIDAVCDSVTKVLQDEFERAKDYVPAAKDWLSSYWEGFHGPNQLSRIRNTGVPMDVLKRVGAAVTALPEWLTPHKQIARVYDARRAAIETGAGVDWALAEALAFGTLLSEGNHVRLSGQDVERGTFSHRHAVVHDQTSGERYTPLAHVYDGQPPGQFTVSNSSLSEFGVLGFELGYALENPNALVLWEAQVSLLVCVVERGGESARAIRID